MVKSVNPVFKLRFDESEYDTTSQNSVTKASQPDHDTPSSSPPITLEVSSSPPLVGNDGDDEHTADEQLETTEGSMSTESLEEDRETTSISGKEMLSCREPGCPYKSYKPSVMVSHARVHSGLKRQREEKDRQSKTRKRRVGRKNKFLKCHEEGCGYITTEPSNLRVQYGTHSDDRRFKCEIEGCSFTSNQAINLKTHTLRRHKDEEGASERKATISKAKIP